MTSSTILDKININCLSCDFYCKTESPNFLGECVKCNTRACKICYETGTWNCEYGCRQCCGKCEDCIKFYKELIVYEKDKNKPKNLSIWFINELKKIMRETHIFIIPIKFMDNNCYEEDIELVKEIKDLMNLHKNITEYNIINNIICSSQSECYNYDCDSCHIYNIIITKCIEIIDGIERTFDFRNKNIYKNVLQQLKLLFKQKRINKKKCSFCKVYNKKNKKCSRCLAVYYCNTQCQKVHWKNHKKICK